MVFVNRQQAALQMIPKLEEYRGKNPLILAIPRGAVPMADALVNSLGGEMDLMMVGKLSSDANPELALGAVTESGHLSIADTASAMGVSNEELQRMASRTAVLLRQRRQAYAPLVKAVDPAGRIVILIDDGIATGATMIAAVEALRMQNPRRIVVATPVASSAAVTRLARVADEVVALSVPRDFYAVSQFYEDFSQVTDEEVIYVLSESRKKKPLQDAFQRGATQVFDQHDPGL